MLKKILATIAVSALFQGTANAIIIDSWTTNEGETGNYILEITQGGGSFDFSLTIDPWNAEALGLFVDFGDATITDTTVSGVSTSPTAGGSITLFDTDTSSNSCGSGCNLDGLNPSLANPDGEWEMVFSLGSQGYEGIQTWEWSIGDSGLSLDSLSLVGIRAQQLCVSGDTLPNGDCEGSDKSYSAADGEVPEPSILALMGLGVLGFGFITRRRKRT
jgi:hypothetical protein